MKSITKRICSIFVITYLSLSVVSCGKQQNNLTDTLTNQQPSASLNVDEIESQQPNTSFDVDITEEQPDTFFDVDIIENQQADFSFDVDYGVPARSETCRTPSGSYDYYEYDGYNNIVYEKHFYTELFFTETFHKYEIENGCISKEILDYNEYSENILTTEVISTYRYEYTKNFEELTCYIYNDDTNELYYTEKYIEGMLISRVAEPACFNGEHTTYVEYDVNGKEIFYRSSDVIDDKLVERYWCCTEYSYNKFNRVYKISYREGNVHKEKGNDGLTYSISDTRDYFYNVKSYELENGMQQDYFDEDGNLVETHIYLDL